MTLAESNAKNRNNDFVYVNYKCDRCGKVVNGFRITGYATAGYYNVENGCWNKYANQNEKIVCDDCMGEDERYLTDYPNMRQYKRT